MKRFLWWLVEELAMGVFFFVAFVLGLLLFAALLHGVDPLAR